MRTRASSAPTRAEAELETSNVSLLPKLRVVAAALAGAAGVGILTGQPLIGVGLLGIIGFGYALWFAPLKRPALGIFFIALLANSPKERPADGAWRSPLTNVGDFLYENLNNLTGISPLRFAGIEAILAALLLAIALRRVFRPEQSAAVPRALGINSIIALSLGAILSLEVMGIGTGGDFKSSLWQIREPLWLPILIWIFQAVELGLDDLVSIAGLVVLAAVIKTAEGFYFYQFISMPMGIRPFYVTTHSDTQLFVSATLVLLVGWMFRRSASRWALAGLALVPIIGIVLNNRRLAWVSLLADLAFIYAALPHSRLKREMTRAFVVFLPVAALYIAVGWNSSSSVFAPVHTLSTILVSKTDASTGTRDVENYNLIQTLKVHPITGWGFGHPYLELSRAYDISAKFALYRFVGHNSVLWLWSVGGLFGFWAVWLPMVVGVFLAARCLRFARTDFQRAVSLVALTVPITCMLQAYGDMGLQSWNGAFLLAITIASFSRTAVSLGAWPPAPVRRGGASSVNAVPLA